MRNKNISCAPTLTWRQHWKALCGLRGCKNNELANRLTFATVNCQMPSASKLLLGLCVSYWWNVYSPHLPNVQPFCSPSIGKHHYKQCLYGIACMGAKRQGAFHKGSSLSQIGRPSQNHYLPYWPVQFLQGCKSPGAWPMWLSVCSVPTTVGLRPALFATWPHIMVRVSPYLTPYYDCGKHLTTVKYPDRGKQIAYYGSTWKNNLQSSVISVQSIAHIVRALEL